MKPILTLSLRGRLLLLFAVFAVLLSERAWHALDMRENNLSIAKKSVWQSVKLVAAEQKGIVRHADQLLLTLMWLPGLRSDWSPDECRRILAERQKVEAPFFNIGLVKTNGDIVCIAFNLAQLRKSTLRLRGWTIITTSI